MIELKNVSKKFSNVEVLKSINLKIYSGEIVGIIGHSGAGKSTLLNIISGIEYPSTGQVKINDKMIDQISQNELADFRNKELGFVFQDHNLLSEFTVEENISIPLYINGLSKHSSMLKVEKILKDLDIYDKAKSYPNELSGGQRQRVAIARAIINNPSILLADEPTGNLDSKNSENIYNLLKALKNSYPFTLIFATHDMEFLKIATKVIEINDGEIV